MKKCSKCRQIKSSDHFCGNKNVKDGLNRWCKECVNKRYKPHPRSKKDKESNKKSARQCYYRRKYNLTLKQYDHMFENQNGVCVICGGINTDGRRLAVDHNHKTGKVRSLLCLKCNGQLAGVEDKIFLKKALKYLDEHNGI